MKNFLPEQEFEASNCHDIISPSYSAKDVNLFHYFPWNYSLWCYNEGRKSSRCEVFLKVCVYFPLHTSPTSMLGVYVYMRKSQFFHFENYYILYQFKFAPESSKYVSFSPTHFFLFPWNCHVTTSSSVFDIAASSKL